MKNQILIDKTSSPARIDLAKSCALACRITPSAKNGSNYYLEVENHKLVIKPIALANKHQIFFFDYDWSQRKYDHKHMTKIVRNLKRSVFKLAYGRTIIPSFAKVSDGHHIHEWNFSKRDLQDLVLVRAKNCDRDWFTIEWRSDKVKVWDVKEAKYKEGKRVILYKNKGGHNQQFRVKFAKQFHNDENLYQIVCAHQQDLAVSLTAPEKCGWFGCNVLLHMELKKSDPNDLNQLWNLDGVRVVCADGDESNKMIDEECGFGKGMNYFQQEMLKF